MKHKIYSYILLFFVPILLSSCFTSSKVKPRNFSENYNINKQDIRSQFKVHHINDSVSNIYFKYHSSDFLHVRENALDSFKIKLSIRYKLFSSTDTRFYLDTAHMLITEAVSPDNNMIIEGFFTVETKKQQKYFLEVVSRDMYRNQLATNFIEIDKGSGLNNQHFLFKKPNGQLLFNNFFEVGDTVLIESNQMITEPFFIQYLWKEFPPALPPFTYQNDLLLSFDKKNLVQQSAPNTRAFQVVLQEEGIYHLKLDSSKQEGITLLCFNENFPSIERFYALAPIMRYITTKKEYEQLLDASGPKPFDDFWLNVGGNNPDRARDFLYEFYHRAERANELFTSYTEGWKTDRGMIYLVYGPPTIVYRSLNSETWVYGEDDNMLSMSFNFSKVNNVFSDNDFILNRSNIYRSTYYKAVDTWRQGRVSLN